MPLQAPELIPGFLSLEHVKMIERDALSLFGAAAWRTPLRTVRRYTKTGGNFTTPSQKDHPFATSRFCEMPGSLLLALEFVNEQLAEASSPAGNIAEVVVGSYDIPVHQDVDANGTSALLYYLGETPLSFYRNGDQTHPFRARPGDLVLFPAAAEHAVLDSSGRRGLIAISHTTLIPE